MPFTQDNALDPLELLARDDKWYLGGGQALLFAPPFPLYLDRPGFWDAAHYLSFAFEPVYTYSLLNEHLREIPLRSLSRRWRPDRLVQQFVAEGLEVSETKLCSADDVLVTEVTVRNTGNTLRQLRAVAWSAQPLASDVNTNNGEAGTGTARLSDGGVEQFTREGMLLALSRTVSSAREQKLPLTLALGMSGSDSYSVNLAEPTANQPLFPFTPFAEKLRDSGLPNEEHLTGLSNSGILYLGVHRTLTIAPGERTTFRVVGALNSAPVQALEQARAALEAEDVVAASEQRWRDFFAGVPTFRCSDPFLEKYYYYRWYGLRLNALNAHEGNYRHPVICEGIGYFRVAVTYSAQAHLRETRWMHQPELPFGIVDTYLEQQRESGIFPAHLYRDWASPSDIYHADWGQVFHDLDTVHPLEERLSAIYQALERYADYFITERADGDLYQIVTQWETGQEYMSRYMAVDPAADEWRPMAQRLTGVDASVYLLRIYDALADLAPQVGQADQAAQWRARSAALHSALLRRCWDDGTQAFHDLTPDGTKIPTLHGTSFYPYFTNVVSTEHLAGLRKHLLNPERFWTEYPVPSSALDDPYFSAEGEWKGKRHNCPWNGRTWPMVNSHIAEALAHSSQLDPTLRQTTAEFITRFVHMLFEDGDLARPNSFEHYNPFTGQASVYRGINDYQHSWVNDLLIRFVAGVQPEAQQVRIDPFPFGVDFRLERVQIRGRWLDVSYTQEEGLRVWLDGVEIVNQSTATAVVVAL